MDVLVLASRKGGVGKTTIACHLAVEAERVGAGPVAILDTDPMQGMAQWWDGRAENTPALLKGSMEQVLLDARDAGFRLLIVDTPPSVGPEVEHATMHASLVMIPVQPSPNDLRAVGSTVDLANRLRKPLVFTINRVKPRVKLTTQAYEALSPHGVIAPLLYDRADYAAAMIDGLTGPELGGAIAPAEIAALWNYTASRLEMTK